MNKNKKVLMGLMFLCLLFIVIGLVLFINNSVTSKKYLTYGLEPASSNMGTFEVEHSKYYYYIGEEDTIKVIKLREDITLDLNFYSQDEEVVSVDNSGNIKALKEGRTVIVVENGYDDYSSIEIIVINPENNNKKDTQKNDYISSQKDFAKPTPIKTFEPQPIPTEEPITDEPTPTEEPTPTPTEEPTPTSNPSKTFEPQVIEPGEIVPGRKEPKIVSNISIKETSVTGYTGDTYQIAAATNDNSTLTYISNNTSVLTVETNGLVKYKTAGTAIVSVSNGSVTKEVTFNVISRERIHFISQLEAKGTNHHTGDAILLESNGHYAMIDLGNPNDEQYTNVVNYLVNNGVSSIDFLLFTHMDADHAGNLQHILEAGIHIKNIWMKNYDVESYRRNYIPNLNSNGIDTGNGHQVSEGNDNIDLNKALARFKRIVYLAEYSKYKDQIGNIKYISSDPEGKKYTFKNLKFTMTLYNNTRNINAKNSENYNSVISLIEVNNHKVLLTGDAYDTKQLNDVAAQVGKVDVFKLPHHGSRMCALIGKTYNGNKYDVNGTLVQSTALSKLKPTFFIMTSSRKKLNNIRNEYNVPQGKLCVDYITSYSNNYKYYVDESKNAVIVDLTNSNINIESK